MMKATISQAKTTPYLYSPPPKKPFSHPSSTISIPLQKSQFFQKDRILTSGIASKPKCCKEGGSISEIDKKLMEDEELNMEIEKMVGMKKLNENCKGIGGIVELLECLEREAIMGEDLGKDANDYNRRAMIFDRSSRVFQALKQTPSGD